MLKEKHRGKINNKDPLDLAAVPIINIKVAKIRSFKLKSNFTLLSFITKLDRYKKYSPDNEKKAKIEVEYLNNPYTAVKNMLPGLNK